MKTFAELTETLNEATSGTYKGVKWHLSKNGSSYALYVDDEKIDIFSDPEDAEQSAKELIDMSDDY